MRFCLCEGDISPEDIYPYTQRFCSVISKPNTIMMYSCVCSWVAIFMQYDSCWVLPWEMSPSRKTNPVPGSLRYHTTTAHSRVAYPNPETTHSSSKETLWQKHNCKELVLGKCGMRRNMKLTLQKKIPKNVEQNTHRQEQTKSPCATPFTIPSHNIPLYRDHVFVCCGTALLC